MSHISNIKKLLSSEHTPNALYCATFFFSGGHGGIFALAFPFVVTLLGGTDKDVGLCFGIGTTAYLVSCLTIANHIDRFNPKRVLQFSSAFIAMTLVGLFICTNLFVKEKLPMDPILMVIIYEILSCLVLALFWPPMMGWLSTGHEGAPLSKRMGIFNISWSLALVVTTFIGGFILKIDVNLAVLASAMFLVMAFIFITVAPAAKNVNKTGNPENRTISHETISPLNPVFRSMSRYGLITGCVALGLSKTQLALFFTENLGFSKPQFGILTAILCFACFAGFYFTAGTKAWHHKLLPFIVSQIMVAAAMLMILYCTKLIWLYTAAAFIGLGQSFVYASHQFYCVSGKVKRSGSMAVHEILISVGYGGGAIAGGYLAEYLTRYWPYWFGLATVIIALVIQAIIFACHKKKI